MSQHATPQNVQALSRITADAAMSLATSTDAITNQIFLITGQPLLDATLSDLASRLDNITTLVDQYDKLTRSLELALTPPAPTT